MSGSLIEAKTDEVADVSFYGRIRGAITDFLCRYRVTRFMDGRFNRSFLSPPIVSVVYFPYFWMVRAYMWLHAYDDGRSYMNFFVAKRYRRSHSR